MTLTEDNFLLFAMNNYSNPQCVDITEFEKDLKIFTYIKKLIAKTGDDGLTRRLVLNHIITIFNLFGDAARDMLFFKIGQEHHGKLITYLIFINRLPENFIPFGLDNNIISELRTI
jgi:hypothetical protein